MIINEQQFSNHNMSKLIKGAIVPRPIAWVSTSDGEGNDNIAPFSFFTVASMDPITLCFSVSTDNEREHNVKDTLDNIIKTKSFVVNIVSESLANQMYESSLPHAPNQDEFTIAGIKKAKSSLIDVPRAAEAPVSMECQLDQVVAVGNSSLVLGRLVCYHIKDDVLIANDKVSPTELNVIGRMAGDYTYIHDYFSLPMKKDS